MDDVVELVVEAYDGALKAEHGTGRNMAPFVETEWGPDAYAVMKRRQGAGRPGGPPEPRRPRERRPARAPEGPQGDPDRGGGGRPLHRVRLLRAAVPEPRPHAHAAPADRRAPRAGAPRRDAERSRPPRRARERISRTRRSTRARWTASARPPARSRSTRGRSRSVSARSATRPPRPRAPRLSSRARSASSSRRCARASAPATPCSRSSGRGRDGRRSRGRSGRSRAARSRSGAPRCRAPRARPPRATSAAGAAGDLLPVAASRGRWAPRPATRAPPLVDTLVALAARAGVPVHVPARRRRDVLRRAVLVEGLHGGARDRREPRDREPLALVGRRAAARLRRHEPVHVRPPPRRATLLTDENRARFDALTILDGVAFVARRRSSRSSP